MSLTVILAFAANLLIAIAKTVAGVITGAASMVAEAAHSWADSGNEVFLMIAERRAARAPDRDHPAGYGREAYVWSMMAAIGLFVAGAAVSIMHGVQELLDPEPASNFVVAYLVFAVAFVLEGISFLQAFRQMRAEARASGRDLIDQAVATSDPTLRAVFAEDFAAVVGILIATAGVLAHDLTGSPIPDAVGSILVGLLLAVVAVVLVGRNRDFLVGQVLQPAKRALVIDGLRQHAEIDRLTMLHVEYVGPRKVLLVAQVDLVGDAPEHELGERLRRLERELESKPAVIRAILSPAASDEADLT
nr:cation transporter [Ruania zhangjianzhongii]